MEFLYLCSSLLFAFLALLIPRLRRSTQSSKHARQLPGPWKLPVIGSAHLLLGSPPHRRLRDLSRRHGPLMLLQLGEVPTVVASSPEAAREITKAHDLAFASRPMLHAVKALSYGGKDVIFAPYGEYWRELRKVCVLELLSARRVQSLRSIREQRVLHLVRLLAAEKPWSAVNLSGRLFALANDITGRAVVGDRGEDQEAFLRYEAEIVEAVGGFSLADLFPSSRLVGFFSGMAVNVLRRSHREVDRIIHGIIKERRETKTDDDPAREDLLGALLRIQRQGSLSFPLTTEIIKAVVLNMFGAGSETSATTLDWAMSELIRNPRVMKRVESEVREVLGPNWKVAEAKISQLSYLKLVIKETLRLHTPVPLLLPRECRETCQVMGYHVAEKTRVVVNAWAIGRDPRIWGDAEEFRPERFDGREIDFKGADFDFIPFGAGRRMCPGMAFGLATVELALASLLYYFDWELPGGMDCSELDMAEAFGATLRRKSELCLHCIPRISCPVA